MTTRIVRKLFRKPKADIPTSRTWQPISEPTIDIVVPARNEAATLRQNIGTLHTYLRQHLTHKWTITIADSASTDDTLRIAQNLAHAFPHVRVVHEEVKGRGRVLKAAWQTSDADILVYLDEDLSTDLSSLPDLIKPLVSGEAPLAIGSRLLPASQTQRSAKRELISRTYVWLLKRTLRLRVSDAQCGFKAIRRDAAQEILVDTTDNAWFFDTELLAQAQHRGWHVHEVPVRWVEDTDSRVHIAQTAWEDIKGIDRVRRQLGQKSLVELAAVAGLLLSAGALYFWDLTINGYANSYYAAAVQAASSSWHAFFYNSLDAAGFVTVDKPPVATWVMALSARVFGFSSFSMLLPNALAGAGTVYLVYQTVRRWFGVHSGLIAGVVMMLTPVAALMFRFNNPDSILTFLLAASAYTLVRAVETNQLRWLAATGVLVGIAFNTKMIQALIVLPAYALVYLLAAKPGWWKRLRQLLVAGLITAVAALWWPVAVSLTPASSRPYIGSSSNNSIWSLIIGYNGVGRLLGTMNGGGSNPSDGAGGTAPSFSQNAASGTTTTGMMPGAGFGNSPLASKNGGPMGNGGGRSGPGGTGFGGNTGIFRMFNGDFGGNIAWFIPAALIVTVYGLWNRRKQARTDRKRAAFLMWGGWLILHIAVFSAVSGVIHPYYPVVMAPAIAALVGMGLPMLWRTFRNGGHAAWILPLTTATTGVLSFVLLGRSLGWMPVLRWIVLAATGLGSVILAWHLAEPLSKRLRNWTFGITAAACLLGPAAYSIATVRIAHNGSIPTAGPTSTAMSGSSNENATAESTLVQYLLKHQGSATWVVAVDSANSSAGIQIATGQPVMALGGFSGSDAVLTLDQFKQLVREGKVQYYATSGSGGMSGGPGGGSSEITTWIKANATVVNYGGTSMTLYKLSVK